MSSATGQAAGARADRDDLSTRVAGRLELVERVLASHAGGVQLVEVSGDGLVRLRFTGMCAGCMLKPLTMAAVVAPALSDIAGVTGVDAAGLPGPGKRWTSGQAHARVLAAQAQEAATTAGLRHA